MLVNIIKLMDTRNQSQCKLKNVLRGNSNSNNCLNLEGIESRKKKVVDYEKATPVKCLPKEVKNKSPGI